MCLSTAFKNKIDNNNILMKNVASFEIRGDEVILKDLMEKQVTLKAHVQEANLLDGTIILNPLQEEVTL